MPAFTEADFTACMFVGAGGLDLQPLLRLSHLLPTRPLPAPNEGLAAESGCVVLNTTYQRGLDLPAVSAALLRQVAATNDFYASELIEVRGAPVVLRREDFGITTVAAPPAGVLGGQWVQRGYMEVFGQHGGAAPSVFALELQLALRTGEGVRHIRYVFIAGESLATFWALSRDGRSSPRIVVTIQSGLLEERDGPMAALLKTMRPPRPAIWVRGRHSQRPPSWAPERTVPAEPAITEASKTYPERLGRFAGWRSDVGAASLFHQPSDRDPTKIAAFAFAASTPPVPVPWQRSSADGQRVVRLVPWTNSPDEVPPLFVGSKRAVQAVAAHGWSCATWRELNPSSHGAATYVGLLDGMLLAEQAACGRELSHVAMTPCGLECEAEPAVSAWLAASDRPMQLDIQYKSPLDFAVVRGAWRDGDWSYDDDA